MPLPKSRIFLLSCLAAVIGMGFGYRISFQMLAGIGILAVVAVTIGWKERVAWAMGLVGIIFMLAAYWSEVKSPDDLSGYFGREVEMVLVIDDDPALKEKSISFPARLEQIGGRDAEDRVAVVLMRYPVYEYGTKLELVGELEPESEFNLKDNVAGQVVFPEISKSEPGHGSSWRLHLYRLKHSLLRKIGSLLVEPHSGLLAGLLLGTRDMPQQLLEQFRITGTSHIVAVSGFNVTIVAGFLDVMLRRFGRSTSFYGSILAIFGFVIITGASASVVRAGIMGSMVLIAQHANRMYASVNALVFSAALMLIDNPKLLEFDIGFQLSFGALAGLLFVHPWITEWLPWKNWATDAIFPTVAAQISTAPLILYHFGNFSAISVLTNFLVLPMIPIAMLVGFLMLVAGYIIPPIGLAFGLLTWLVLEYIIRVVDLTARIPGAAFSEIPFPFWALGLYYAALLIALKKCKPKPRTSSSF